MSELPAVQHPDQEPAQLGPNSQEAEEALLGMCLDDYTVFPRIAPVTNADHFYFVRNGYIFEAMQAIYDRNDDVHMLAVIYELRRMNRLEEIGGVNYLTTLQNNPLVYQRELAEVMADLVFAAFIRRQLMNAAGDIANHAKDDNSDLKSIVDYVEQRVFSVTRQVGNDGGLGEIGAAQAMNAVTDRLLTYSQDKRPVRGYSTGIPRLDQILHGILPGDLIGVIGRSGSGKTTIMCQFAIAAVQAGLHVVHFPTEQTVEQYTVNLVSHLLKRPLDDFYAGNVPTADILHAEQEIRRWSLTFYDRTAPTPMQVTTFVREKIRQKACDLVIVDGMSDMGGKGEIYQRTTDAMIALHSLMRDGVPVIFSVQANRKPAERREKRPLMSDAQGGDVIGQRCTRFLSLYRPGYDVEVGEIEAKDLGQSFDPRYVEIRLVKDRFFNQQGETAKGIWIAGQGLQDASAKAPEYGNGRH